MKNKLLNDLYDCFYTPPALSSEHQEVEECHQALIKALEKPERRLVLRIIDAKDHIIADTSIDSFISGFRLAWKLFTELNQYENERPVSCRADKELGAHFICEEEDEIARRIFLPVVEYLVLPDIKGEPQKIIVLLVPYRHFSALLSYIYSKAVLRQSHYTKTHRIIK